jgi:hypothetical protein
VLAVFELQVRVHEMHTRMTRRMMTREVGSAFACWVGHWEARTYALMHIRRAANMLHKPELSDAFWHAPSHGPTTRDTASDTPWERGA